MNIPKKKNDGFSLLETIVYVAIFTMITIAVGSAIVFFYRSNRYTLEQASAVDSARKGVTAMVRTIREANYSDAGAYPIIGLGPNTLSLYANIDSDTSSEKVQFFLDGTLFKRITIEPSGYPLVIYDASLAQETTISDNVRNGEQHVDIFEYYDRNGTLITDMGKIGDLAFVRVNLIVNVNPLTLPNEYTLRSSATLRNLKTNL